MLQALVDGELDAANAARIEAQIAGCAACAAQHTELIELRAALKRELAPARAPDRLRERLAASLAEAAPAPRSEPATHPPRRAPAPWSWLGAGAMLATAACAGLFAVSAQLSASDALTRDLVAGHVRSLEVGHLTDVATSDQHVVKPWFEGKLDFSPPVVELASQGFPLVGGRLDYIGGRTVAAIVYRRGHHPINLFIWPASRGAAGRAETAPGDGYTLLHWSQGGMTFWAVSDVNPADLRQFETDLRATTPP
jgi:anti-sigma factor RsiW